MGKIIIGIVFIIGGLSGTLVLRGTNSGAALAAVGFGMLIWGIIQMVTGDKQEEEEIKPDADENLVKIFQILINKEALSQEEVYKKLGDFIDGLISNIKKMDEYYKVMRTMKEIETKNILPSSEYQKKIIELEQIHKNLQYEELISKKAKPQIDALMLEKTNNTISPDEYRGRFDTIMKETRFQVEEDIRTRPTMADIDDSIKEKLAGPKLNKVENFLKRMEKGEIIVLYNNNHIKLFSKENWTNILEEQDTGKYEKIFERV